MSRFLGLPTVPVPKSSSAGSSSGISADSEASPPRTETSRGVFCGPQKQPKNAPQPPKPKTSKTRINNPFQELSLKPSYSSHRKDAHSRILAPKGPNRAKIEFSGQNPAAYLCDESHCYRSYYVANCLPMRGSGWLLTYATAYLCEVIVSH